MEQIAITKIKNNPNNPRYITDEKFEKLVKSIKEFPEMLNLRPIVVDEDMIVLGGNMRLKACTEAGLKKVPYVVFTQAMSDKMNKENGTNKTYQQHCDEFIIKDNVPFGQWDWAKLSDTWDNASLNEWGMDVPLFEDDIDYSIMDDIDEEVEEAVEGMDENTRKAVLIDFHLEDYEKALKLMADAREKGIYIGQLLIKSLEDAGCTANI